MKKNKPCFGVFNFFACTTFIICLGMLLFPLAGNTQLQSETGLPFITNYSPKTYKAYPQTWCVQEDETGIMYFGIQSYILEYDGVKWNKIPLLKSAVRSMAMHKDGLIYFGGFTDLGYLDNDSLGQKKTYSLFNLIPAENRNFLDIWTTHSTESGVYFQAREYIFRLEDKKPGSNEKRKVKIWKPSTKFMYSFYIDNNYYVHQQGLGLFKMVNDSLVLIPSSEFLGKERMQIMLPYKTATNEKQYLIGMFYSGLYLFNGTTFQPFTTNADAIIKSGSILYKGLLLKNGNYVLSTTGKGLVIIDAQGNLLQKINRDVGLQDESIYASYQDKKGTLWLGLDNGISRVETASPLTKFSLQSGINTGVLNINRFNGDLYIGTTNGLLAFNSKTSFFDPVPGIPQNQVFALLQDGKQLLIPGDGLFALKDKKISTIRASVSADLTLSALYISKKYPDILLGGGTFGVAVFDRNSGTTPGNVSTQWHFAGYVPGITDQIWSFTENKDGSIWAGTQSGPVYNINFSFDENGNVNLQKTKFEKYGAEHGFKDGTGQVYSIKGINYFYAENSLYTFDEKVKRFIPDSTFGIFENGGGNTEYDMVEDQQGRVWIRFGKETRLAIPKPEGGYRIDKSQLSTISELTIQKIYPENNGIVWVCTTDGLIRYDENLEKNVEQSYKTVIRFASAGKNILSTAVIKDSKPVSVSYKNNTLRFEYAAPFFEQEDKTTYQTWLEGFEKDWSDFDNNYYKEYTNIPTGDYHFHVRAKNIYQKLSEEAVYHFSIYPPWYATWWAYVLYALAAIVIIYSFIRWRTKQLHEKHRELEITVAERTKQLSLRVEELAVINSVQDGLVREMDMQGIYELVGEKIREIFNAQVIDIVTYDNKTNLLIDRYAYEKGDRTLIGTWEPYGFRKQVIDTGQLLLINEDLEKKSIESNSKAIHGEQPKSAVFVPMISGSEVKGIISLQDLDKENAFTDSDVNLLTTLANSMSVALESARRFDETNRLLKETEQRTAELSVINSVQDGLARELDIHGIYKLVGDRLCGLFPDTQTLVIRTFNYETNQEYFEYFIEKGEDLKVEPRPFMWANNQLIQSKKPLLINENYVETAKKFGGTGVTKGQPPKSAVFVPMIVGEVVKGSISLQNVDMEFGYSDSDLRLLTTLTNSMSVALENARLFDETNRLLKETEQRKAELAVINSVQEGLVREIDMQAIYDLVGNRLYELFNTTNLVIRTFDHESGKENWRYAIEKGERQYIEPKPFIWANKQLIQSKKPIHINENYVETSRKYGGTGVTIGQPPKSAVFVPMIVGDVVKGSVSLQNVDKENAYTDADLRLLTTLTNSMSVALENARLFDETNRLLKETEQRTAELAVINSVQDGLAKELDMQGIYNLVGDRVQKLFNAQAVIIATFDLDNKTEHFNYTFENNEIIKLESRPITKLRQLLIDKKHSIYISTEEQAKKDYGITAVAATQMPKSLLFVPMLTGNMIRGYVSLQNIDTENAFSESDIRLLETLASSMSVALENARLFDETNRLLKETEQRTAELAVINSVQDGLAKELDMQGIYNLVGDRVQKLFNAQVVLIATFDLENKTEHFNYFFENNEKVKAEPRTINKLRQLLIDKKHTIYISTEERGTKEYGLTPIAGTQMTKSMLFVPMLTGNMIRGYVSLQNIDTENAFSESDIRLLETLANSMSVALENARLFDETNRLLKETEQRTAELAVINSVQEGLARELDMQAIYDLVGDRIRDLFDAQSVGIATFDHEARTEHYKYVFEKGTRYYPEPRPFDKLRQHLIQSRQKILINSDFIGAYNKFGMKAVSGTELPKSALFVPLIIGDKITSYVTLQNIDRENAFSDSDVRLLETLSNSMSVALENARLFDETTRLLKETEQRTAELAVINSVQDGLAKELDIQGIYDLVGDRIIKVFNAPNLVIRTFDHETGKENWRYAVEKGERQYIEPKPFVWHSKQMIQSQKPIQINENYLETSKKFGGTGVFVGQPTKSGIFVPMIVGGIVKGSVSLQNVDKENAYTEADLRLLTTITNSMSVALENARLFDETNRLLKETEQRTAELSVINSVQDGLARELDISGIYDLVGEKMREIFNAQVIDIVAYDKTTNLIADCYTYEKGDRTLLGPRPLKGFRKHVIETAKSLVINKDVYQERSKYDQTVITGKGAKSIVLVPMIAGGEVTGVISLQNLDQENAFSDSDVNLLSTLSNSMSVALESARLFDETTRLLKETEQRTAELAVINSVQEGLAKELDMQGIYNMVGDRLCSLFPDTQILVIRTFEHDTGLEHWQYVIEKGTRFYNDPSPFTWANKQLIQTKKYLHISENYVETAKKYGGTGVSKGQPPKSAIFVPMIVGDLVKGSVSLQNVDRENAFNDSDIRLLTTLTNSMSVALENARLFDETNRLLKETEQRTAELAVINSVQEGLAKELDMQGIYNLVGDRLCELFPDSQTLVIRTFEHETGFEHWQYAKEKGIRQNVEPRPLNWNSKELILTKKPLDIKKNYVETSIKHGGTGVTAGQPPKSAVFVPMLVGDVVRGSISLQNVDKENAFTDSDLRLLTTITNSMSVALENARLFDETNRLLKETEQRTGELAVINSVQEGLVREMDMQAIYEIVGDRLCNLFNIQTVVIRTFDHETGFEHWQYAKEKGIRQYVDPRPLNWNSKQLILTKKPLDIKENYLETSKKYGGTGVTAGQPPKSAVFVPMIVGDVVKGSVSLQNVDKENAFSDSDLSLLTTLTNSMSVALENARLFDETTLLLAESKQRAAELSTVNSISKALASQLDPDDLINMVGDQLKNLFRANIVYLALLNKKTNIIHFPYQYGDEMAPIKLGEGLTSKIIQNGEPLLINKDLQELRAQLGIQVIGVPAASYLGVPIPVGEENIGVLSVQSTEHENRFNENDLRLLSTIASSVGVALNNATLFEDVQQAKMEAEAAGKAAEKANDAKSAFLSTVSHELRTPLTSVLGFAKIIRKRLDEKIFPIVNKKDPKTDKTINQISENLNVVISEGERLTHLINDVLDLAKIEAGKMEWNQENVSMSEVAERAIAATTSLFDQKALKLIKKIDADLPDIIGDRDKLIQVIINLISNSVKFTDKGSVTCSVMQDKDELIVTISDTGIGIAPEDFGAVFEQFKQVGGDTLTDKPKGTGLGLPICKEIVEHHGGRIWLESEIGKGSKFSFALPVSKTTIEARPMHLNDLVRQLKEQVAQSQLNFLGTASNILIVDDDDSIRSLLHQELGDAGYNITEASNGKEALSCVRNQKPDLIILDVMMPEMNGFDVAAVLKNDPSTMDIPIIVLSVVQDKTRGFRIGVDRYLTKPIDTGLLFSEIGSLLEQGKSKKKVMVVDQDSATVSTLTEVLKTKGYSVMEANEKELVEKAVANQPDIIIINSFLSGKQDIVQTLRFEKGLENVLFLVYQ